MTASDYFECARLSARELREAVTELATLEEADEQCVPWHPRSDSGAASPGAHGDPTAAAAEARIQDLGRMISARREAVAELRAVVRECQEVVAGIGAACGLRRSRVVSLYYVDLADTWSEVARELGVSLRTVYSDRDAAFEWLDAMGVSGARAAALAAEKIDA